MLTIPRELDDAARVDGAGRLTILRRVILPLSRPAIVALAIFLFQVYWNDFFWPNVFLSSPDKLTLPLGLVSLQGAAAIVLAPALALVTVAPAWFPACAVAPRILEGRVLCRGPVRAAFASARPSSTRTRAA